MRNDPLPRAFGEPVMAGVIRSEPEDFFVAEEPGFDLDGEGEHHYLHIEKRGQNTAWVAERLASFARVRAMDVSYSGRKDRHAVTHQWFSVWLPGRPAPAWETLSIPGVRIMETSRHSRKLRRGSHAANRFSVRLRDMTSAADIDTRLSMIRDAGFPNYFGEQRFGRDGGNLARADALLRGDVRPDRKKDIYLSAARSHLFNLELAGRVADGSWCEDGAWGWLPGSHRRPTETFRATGFDAWYEGLERLGVKAMRRPQAAHAPDLAWRIEDDAFIVDFRLESGAFATSLLREFADYRQAADGDVGTGAAAFG